MAPGIRCFGKGNAYAHGGVSIQECLIPVLSITAGGNSGGAVVEITKVNWVGLRCRVQVETVQDGLSLDLRTKVGDESSSVSKVQALGNKGSASLLVEDDELEGEPVAVVVLDANQRVVTKLSTIIGGEA